MTLLPGVADSRIKKINSCPTEILIPITKRLYDDHQKIMSYNVVKKMI
jgi:hypothetical protein